MINAVRSELTRMSRRNLILSWAGLIAVFAVAINFVMFSFTAKGTSLPGGGPGLVLPSLQILTTAKGLVAGVGAASSLFGVITLSFWAVITATDYSSGLIRLLVAAEPRRWPLVGAKLCALALYSAGAAAVAVVVNLVAAPPGAKAAGVSTAAWSTGVTGNVASAWLNTWCAMLVWGVLGMAIAIVTRSAAIAISVGVGYVLVVETLIKTAAESAGKYLPGSVLTALAQDGSQQLSHAVACMLGAGYVVVALAIAGTVFLRRGVTD